MRVCGFCYSFLLPVSACLPVATVSMQVSERSLLPHGTSERSLLPLGTSDRSLLPHQASDSSLMVPDDEAHSVAGCVQAPWSLWAVDSELPYPRRWRLLRLPCVSPLLLVADGALVCALLFRLPRLRLASGGRLMTSCYLPHLCVCACVYCHASARGPLAASDRPCTPWCPALCTPPCPAELAPRTPVARRTRRRCGVSRSVQGLPRSPKVRRARPRR